MQLLCYNLTSPSIGSNNEMSIDRTKIFHGEFLLKSALQLPFSLSYVRVSIVYEECQM